MTTNSKETWSKAIENFNNSTVKQKDDFIKNAFENLESLFAIGVPTGDKSDKVTNSPFEVKEKIIK